MNIVKFLIARLDEQEADVKDSRALSPYELHWSMPEWLDRDYLLADIAAKRRILALHDDDGWDYCPICLNPDDSDLKAPTPCEHLRLLAAPFARHPDFDPAWAVPMS